MIEKNRVLTEDNRKLTERCTNLEELLNEEETDINVVLDMIGRMESCTNGPPQQSLITGTRSKLRDFK